MMRIEEEDSLELVLREEAVPEADDRWQTLEIRAPKECRYGISLPQRSRRSESGTDGRGGTASEGTVCSML